MAELLPEDILLMLLLKESVKVADAESDCRIVDAIVAGAATLRALADSDSRLSTLGRADNASERLFILSRGMSDARYKAFPDMIRHRWRTVEAVQSRS